MVEFSGGYCSAGPPLNKMVLKVILFTKNGTISFKLGVALEVLIRVWQISVRFPDSLPKSGCLPIVTSDQLLGVKLVDGGRGADGLQQLRHQPCHHLCQHDHQPGWAGFSSIYQLCHLTIQPTAVEAWSTSLETAPYLAHRSSLLVTQLIWPS